MTESEAYLPDAPIAPDWAPGTEGKGTDDVDAWYDGGDGGPRRRVDKHGIDSVRVGNTHGATVINVQGRGGAADSAGGRAAGRQVGGEWGGVVAVRAKRQVVDFTLDDDDDDDDFNYRR